MRTILHRGAALLPLTIALAACSGSQATTGQPKPKAAELSIFVDGSASTAFITSPAYTDAAIKRAGQAVMRQKQGDSFRIIRFGDRSVGNSMDVFTAKSGYQLELAGARKQVEAALYGLTEHNRANGGDGWTNLTYSLENARPTCTPRSHVLILSDGIVEDGSYSAAKALAAGQPVHLPPPSTPYLKGCTVEIIGVGMAPADGGKSAETLPNAQVQRLIAGLREYLAAAGVSTGDMAFTSVI